MYRRASRFLAFVFLVSVLVACQSSEDRAEEHYQNALNLIEEGDFDRARIEFQNVFRNNGQHREARTAFAEMLRDQGNIQRAYRQYLRLVEQYPDDAPARLALAQMAIETQSWEQALLHGGRALELAPDAPEAAVIALNLDYATAVEEENAADRRATADQARALLQDRPEALSLYRILVDNALQDSDFDTALRDIDAALAVAPQDRAFYDIQVALLAQLERTDELEALLRDMVVRFPEDPEVPGMLLRFLVALGEPDEAQDFLRELAATTEDPEQRREAQVALVQLALQQSGAEAALAEIDTILDGTETEENRTILRAFRASIVFDNGDREAAIAEMEDLLETELSLEDRGRYQVVLARMLMQTGNQVGARALVEEILAADAGQVDALKMKASWLIEEDATREAIALLRTALDSSPDDTEALILTAEAHLRNGDRDLAREFLALAVDASNAAPDTSLRYANFLAAEERFLLAEEVLIDALRLVPGDLRLLSALGEVYINMEDWARAEQVEDTLRRQENATATSIADGLQASRLATQGQMDEAIAFLEALAAADDTTSLQADIALVRARLINGDTAGALDYVTTLLEENPTDFTLRSLMATTQAAVGRFPEATEMFRDLIAEQPQIEELWMALIRLLYAQGDTAGAEATLQEGLEALPEALNLLWAQASFQEQQRDFEGAIALYEIMYDRAPNQPIIANNLASMLSTYRDDDESLERAHMIARRLRGSDFAPFQDTYGWIAYRRGAYEEALEHLEPAAAALADDPLVQFHLGMTYAALERTEDAIAQLRRSIELAGPEDERPQFDVAQEELSRLEAAMQAQEEETSDSDG